MNKQKKYILNISVNTLLTSKLRTAGMACWLEFEFCEFLLKQLNKRGKLHQESTLNNIDDSRLQKFRPAPIAAFSLFVLV